MVTLNKPGGSKWSKNKLMVTLVSRISKEAGYDFRSDSAERGMADSECKKVIIAVLFYSW